jgi:hypothetical protein
VTAAVTLAMMCARAGWGTPRARSLLSVLSIAVVTFIVSAVEIGLGQQRDGFVDSFRNPAIDYYGSPTADVVSDLTRRLNESGGADAARLTFDPATGYLKSVLDTLEVPVESQIVVFSQTSLQAPIVNAKNPRALYFNDRVSVGWVRGGEVLELSALDPQRGLIFYTLEQKAESRPKIERRTDCLRCHVSWDTFGVPGLLVLSTGPDDAAGYATGGMVDDRDDFSKRWGGWFVTGRALPANHMGKAITHPPWLAVDFDTTGYLTPHSDVAALMVLEHQTRATNLLIYLGFEARVGASDARLRSIVLELVDELLFVDEARLPGRIEGSSGFAARFAALGHADSRGRSLHQLDLKRRLLRYPCSYLVDSAVFDGLPVGAKTAVYARMWLVLSGKVPDAKYARLSLADRRAVIEILGETKPDAAAYFAEAAR